MKSSLQSALYNHLNARLDGRQVNRKETAELERVEIANTLSKNKCGKVDDFSRLSLEKSYNSQAMAANSAALYNFEQEQICRVSGTHPNDWRIYDGGGIFEEQLPLSRSSCDSESSTSDEENQHLQKKRSSEGELKQEAFARSIPDIYQVVHYYFIHMIFILYNI